MPALVAGIHALLGSASKTWMPASSPAMTNEGFSNQVETALKTTHRLAPMPTLCCLVALAGHCL